MNTPTIQMGDTVLYTLADGPRAGTDRAALVNDVQPDGRLALSVLTNPATDGLGATYHDYNVPHSETPKPRTWRHRPTPEPDLFGSEN